MAKAKGLGKGLDALMGDATLQTQEAGSVLLPILIPRALRPTLA